MLSQEKKSQEYILKVPKDGRTEDEVTTYLQDQIGLKLKKVYIKKIQKLPFTHFNKTKYHLKNLENYDDERPNFGYYYLHLFSHSPYQSSLQTVFPPTDDIEILPPKNFREKNLCKKSSKDLQKKIDQSQSQGLSQLQTQESSVVYESQRMSLFIDFLPTQKTLATVMKVNLGDSQKPNFYKTSFESSQQLVIKERKGTPLSEICKANLMAPTWIEDFLRTRLNISDQLREVCILSSAEASIVIPALPIRQIYDENATHAIAIIGKVNKVKLLDPSLVSEKEVKELENAFVLTPAFTEHHELIDFRWKRENDKTLILKNGRLTPPEIKVDRYYIFLLRGKWKMLPNENDPSVQEKTTIHLYIIGAWDFTSNQSSPAVRFWKEQKRAFGEGLMESAEQENKEKDRMFNLESTMSEQQNKKCVQGLLKYEDRIGKQQLLRFMVSADQ